MDAVFRRALRVLRMVHEFHKRGHQLLRIAPGMAPSGCSWRCAVAPRSNILRSHGAMLGDFGRDAAHYTTASENEYFGWTDAREAGVAELADRFAERFPGIVDASRGDDWNYAGWYVRMLGYAEQERFPIAYADWDVQSDPRFLPLSRGESDLPIPPPGDADEVRS